MTPLCNHGPGLVSLHNGATAPPPPESASGGVSTGSIHVSLDVFEGPLDLLLRLIERKGLEVTAVSIVAVAGQYLEQIRAWQEINIAVTAEFLTLAARLLLLKSRALLPRPVQEVAVDADPADADARDLVDRLTIYKAFVGLAGHLRSWQDEGRASYARPALGDLPDYLLASSVAGATEQAALLGAVVRCLRRARRRDAAAPRAVAPSPLDLDYPAVLAEVGRRVAETPPEGVLFDALLPSDASVLVVVATFLALLELVRQGAARLVQERLFGPLLVRSAVPLASPVVGV